MIILRARRSSTLSIFALTMVLSHPWRGLPSTALLTDLPPQLTSRALQMPRLPCHTPIPVNRSPKFGSHSTKCFQCRDCTTQNAAMHLLTPRLFRLTDCLPSLLSFISIHCRVFFRAISCDVTEINSTACISNLKYFTIQR